MFVKKLRAEKKKIVNELKEANAKLKHEKVISEKMKAQAIKSKNTSGNMSPNYETRSKSRNKSFEDNSFTKISNEITGDKYITKTDQKDEADYNMQAIINKRQSIIKDTIVKLSKELANEEIEVKLLTNELNM